MFFPRNLSFFKKVQILDFDCGLYLSDCNLVPDSAVNQSIGSECRLGIRSDLSMEGVLLISDCLLSTTALHAFKLHSTLQPDFTSLQR